MESSTPQQSASLAKQGDALYHGKALAHSTVGKHPETAAIVIAVLVLAVVVLLFYGMNQYQKAQKCAKASSFSGGYALDYASSDYGIGDTAQRSARGDDAWGRLVARRTDKVQCPASCGQPSGPTPSPTVSDTLSSFQQIGDGATDYEQSLLRVDPTPM